MLGNSIFVHLQLEQCVCHTLNACDLMHLWKFNAYISARDTNFVNQNKLWFYCVILSCHIQVLSDSSL